MMPPPVPARAALIVPALNEEAAIGKALGEVPRELFAAIIVADNASTDRTAEVARAKGATVVHEPEKGYGAACLRALASLPDAAEVVVFMDGDGSDVPEQARLLLAPIYEGRADLVIGSRTLGRAEKGSLARHQRLGNRLVTFLIRLLYGRRFTDLGPFRAIRADALRRLGLRDRNYGWTVEMQVRALQHGLRILEIPVSHRRRIGVSKISGHWKSSLLAGAKMIWTVFRLRFARPTPPAPCR